MFDRGPIVPIEKKFLEAEIEIYGTNQKIVKSTPIKLYIGSVYKG